MRTRWKRVSLGQCRIWFLKTCNFALVVGGVGIVLLLLGVGGVYTWEYTNSSDFCAHACHAVHPEEPEAYRDSYHARVKCVECHLGRVSTFKALAIKATHMKHLWSIITRDYDRPLASHSMRPANESCERCHWPQAFYSDRLREIHHYERDESSTQITTRLALRTGGGTAREGRGKGIHWHIENRVRYIATDNQRQQIPWVEVTHENGSQTIFTDVTNPLSPEQIASLPKKVLDCVDCHNRVGHPFENPERAVDRAISLGRMDRKLPYTKAWATRLLEYVYDTQEQAYQLVEVTREAYRYDYPELFAANREAIKQSEQVMKELLHRIKFKEPGISWRSFPNDSGHSDFPGCFRCHDGTHINPQGESIRLHCNICHDIPTVYREGETPVLFPPLATEEPPSHLEANFISDHRFLASKPCARCHIEIQFGSDNRSFCSNPACHGRKWPSVDLDAHSPHPIPLEGKHAETWCHECHKGTRRPDRACQSCHQRPDSHDFELACERCHTTVRWLAPSAKDRRNAPAMPHDDTFIGACSGCHNLASASSFPSNHGEYPPQACPFCHQADAPTPTPHAISGRNNCLACHALGSTLKPVPEDHKERAATECLYCHGTWDQVAHSRPAQRR